MTMVRWDMYNRLKEEFPDINIHITYGAATKLARQELGIKKTHSNDAYCMGTVHPAHRCHFEHYKKIRRNNRVLEKFYDAVYIDIRDGKKKKGSEIGCNRTNRSIPRSNDENERIYHGKIISKGHRSIRRRRYSLRPGDIIEYKGSNYIVKGIQSNGKAVALENGPAPSVKSIKIIKQFYKG